MLIHLNLIEHRQERVVAQRRRFMRRAGILVATLLAMAGWVRYEMDQSTQQAATRRAQLDDEQIRRQASEVEAERERQRRLRSQARRDADRADRIAAMAVSRELAAVAGALPGGVRLLRVEWSDERVKLLGVSGAEAQIAGYVGALAGMSKEPGAHRIVELRDMRREGFGRIRFELWVSAPGQSSGSQS